MIISIKDRRTKAVFEGLPVKGIGPDIRRQARRKLLMIDAAASLDDLRVPPNNRLKAMIHDRRGQYSIRINDQFRICFVWKDSDAYDVELVDYH